MRVTFKEFKASVKLAFLYTYGLIEMVAFYIAISLAVVLLLLNIIATYIVSVTYFEIKQRRVYQLLFVWLFPLLGAILTIYLNREEWFKDKQQNKVGNHTNISDSEAVKHGVGSGVGR